jgi:hypothetical protein
MDNYEKEEPDLSFLDFYVSEIGPYKSEYEFIDFVTENIDKIVSGEIDLRGFLYRFGNDFFVDEHIFNPWNMMPGYTNLEAYDKRVEAVYEIINNLNGFNAYEVFNELRNKIASKLKI